MGGILLKIQCRIFPIKKCLGLFFEKWDHHKISKTRRKCCRVSSPIKLNRSTHKNYSAKTSVRDHIKIKMKNKNECPAPLLSFNDLSLKDSMPRKTLESFRNNGWIKPTPIQSQVIPAMLSHKEVLAISPTGSGKTLSFLIPIMIGLRRETNNKP